MLSVDIEKQLGDFHLAAKFESMGGVTALFGNSGSGKTSIVNMVAGLVTPDRGRIALADTALFDSAARINVPAHRRRIGYVFQEGRLFPHLSVAANLDYGRRMCGLARDESETGRIVDAARHRPSARPPARQAVGRRAPARRGRPRAADAPAPAAARRAAGLARHGPSTRDHALPGPPARRSQGADGLCQPPRGGAFAPCHDGGAHRGRPRRRSRRRRNCSTRSDLDAL